MRPKATTRQRVSKTQAFTRQAGRPKRNPVWIIVAAAVLFLGLFSFFVMKPSGPPPDWQFEQAMKEARESAANGRIEEAETHAKKALGIVEGLDPRKFGGMVRDAKYFFNELKEKRKVHAEALRRAKDLEPRVEALVARASVLKTNISFRNELLQLLFSVETEHKRFENTSVSDRFRAMEMKIHAKLKATPKPRNWANYEQNVVLKDLDRNPTPFHVIVAGIKSYIREEAPTKRDEERAAAYLENRIPVNARDDFRKKYGLNPDRIRKSLGSRTREIMTEERKRYEGTPVTELIDEVLSRT